MNLARKNSRIMTLNLFWLTFTKYSLNMEIQTQIIGDLDRSSSNLEREQCEGLFTKEELSDR